MANLATLMSCAVATLPQLHSLDNHKSSSVRPICYHPLVKTMIFVLRSMLTTSGWGLGDKLNLSASTLFSKKNIWN